MIVVQLLLIFIKIMKIYYVIFDKVEFKYVSQIIHRRRHHI